MQYGTIMIDPPWQQTKGGHRKARAGQRKDFSYKTHDTDAIFSLLDTFIFPMASKDHAVFIWVIDKFLTACEYAMQVRGYKRHCRFVWDKGNGIAPAFTVRYCHEYLIWYYKTKQQPIAKEARGKFGSVLHERSRQHSRKPDAAYHMVEMLYPDTQKLDVFSREKRKQWALYGDEPDYYKNIE
jgi:N6-adenosine-specific RNA methylase IME4